MSVTVYQQTLRNLLEDLNLQNKYTTSVTVLARSLLLFLIIPVTANEKILVSFSPATLVRNFFAVMYM